MQHAMRKTKGKEGQGQKRQGKMTVRSIELVHAILLTGSRSIRQPEDATEISPDIMGGVIPGFHVKLRKNGKRMFIPITNLINVIVDETDS